MDHVIARSNGQVIGRDDRPVMGSIKDHAKKVYIPLSECGKWENGTLRTRVPCDER